MKRTNHVSMHYAFFFALLLLSAPELHILPTLRRATCVVSLTFSPHIYTNNTTKYYITIKITSYLTTKTH